MQKLTKYLAFAAVLIVTAVIPFATASAVSPPDTQYVALGDSFAQGIGAPVPAQTGYVAQVEKRYFHSAYPGSDTTLNLAADQVDTTTETLITDGQLGDAVAAITDPSTDTKLITLTVGGNDLLRLLRSGPCTIDPNGPACYGLVVNAITQAAGNYPLILGTLTAAAGGADIVVTTYYNPFDGTGAPVEAPVEAALQGADGVIDCAAAAANPANTGLNDVIACTAAAFGVDVADVHGLFEGRTFELTHIAEGDIHPTKKGHRVIADAIIAATS